MEKSIKATTKIIKEQNPEKYREAREAKIKRLRDRVEKIERLCKSLHIGFIELVNHWD